jgi:crossover junction endodeoxyribonuclease RuvC
VTRVLAVDAAATCGFALGDTGAEPRFGSRNFTGGNASGEVVARFSRFLRAIIEREKPDVIAYEAPYFPMGFRRGPPANAKTLRRLLGMAEIIDAIAWDYRDVVRRGCYQATAGEICAYLTGKANWGGRAQKKAATIAAARAWGWVVTDDNAADACAVWAYAESILDPVAAAQRRARLGLELALHPPNEDARQARSAGRRGSSARHKKSGGSSNGKKSNTASTGEFQFATG